MRSAPLCKVCNSPARKKCTSCGELFCDLHIRYGNPRFAFRRLVEGSSGNYCDACWEKYKKIADRNKIIIFPVYVVAVLIFITIFLGTFISFIFHILHF